jgi:hypothetical protein
MSAGWLGETRMARFDVPDFSEVPGWQAAWNFPPDGSAEPWQVSAQVGAQAAPPVTYRP